MSEKENRITEEKVYTLEDIIQEIQNEQDSYCYSEDQIRGLTKQNISVFLTNFFNEMGLNDAKEKLKNGGKDYAFTEKEKSIIKNLILERNGKLRRNKSGKYKEQIENPDFEFLFNIVNSIKKMLERRGYDEEKLQIATERYMINFLKNEASISNTIFQKLQKLIENKFSDENILNVFDKFLWMRAMEKELNEIIDKWDLILEEYIELLKDIIIKRIEEQYEEPYESKTDNESSALSKGKKFDECVHKYFTEWGADQIKLLKEEELLSEKKKIEEGLNKKIQYYRDKVDKRTKEKDCILGEVMQAVEETMKIDDKLKMIEKKKEKIWFKCQELAYDELFGEDDEKFFLIYDRDKILQKAKENVENYIGCDNTGRMQINMYRK